MFYINIPSLNEIQDIQEQDSAYYWSGLAETLFRTLGLVSVCTRYTDNALENGAHSKLGTEVVLRGAKILNPDHASTAPVVFEMPDGEVAARCSGRPNLDVLNINKAVLRRANDMSIGTIVRQRIRIRLEDREIVSFEPKDKKWSNASFPVQVWPEDCGDVLAWLDLGEDVKVPAIIRIASKLIFTFPIFDVAGCWFSFPPLDERYAGIEGGRAPSSSFRFCVNVIEDHHTKYGTSELVKARPFPEPYTSALSVRHDYDRPISDESWSELLDFYDKKGITASFSILTYLMPQHVLNLVESKGHEIQLHCYAHNEYDLRCQIEELSERIEQPIEGVTIHGGPSGVGFRGDTHNLFFERSGLSYAEGYGVRDFTITPLARLVEGIPKTSRLVAPPFHFSLDGSTRPEDHRLEKLSKDLPVQLKAGRYIVVMNHPDIHRDELYALLDGLDISECWTPSTKEALNFARVTRLATHVFQDESGGGIRIGARLDKPALFEIIEGPQKNSRNVRVDAGDISVRY